MRDLMEKNHLGRLIACGPGLDGGQGSAAGLHYPHGLAIAPDGKTLWFTESWNHRLSRAAITGRAIAAAESWYGNHAGLSRAPR